MTRHLAPCSCPACAGAGDNRQRLLAGLSGLAVIGVATLIIFIAREFFHG